MKFEESTGSMSEYPYSPGLEGVPAGTTAISEIDPSRQKLAYRGYDIEDLADHATFEEVAFLLLEGTLPTTAQFELFKADLVAERSIPDSLIGLFRAMPNDCHPMDTLRTAVSFLGQVDPDVNDNSHAANLRKAKRLTAKTGTCIAAAHRIRQGQEPIAPRADLDHAQNFLFMLTGSVPEDFCAKCFDTSLILYVEHSFNASTFSGRVIVSTTADLHCGVVGAIGALKGPLHGGANEKAMAMFLEIGTPDRAEAFVRDLLARKQRIMGIGHRVYKTGDSRVPTLKRIGQQLGEHFNDLRWVQIADTIETIMREEKNMHPNVDFSCAYVYYYLGLPIELYTPIFAAARVVGWSAHIIEQLDDNRLIRPSCLYNGERGREWVALDQR